MDAPPVMQRKMPPSGGIFRGKKYSPEKLWRAEMDCGDKDMNGA